MDGNIRSEILSSLAAMFPENLWTETITHEAAEAVFSPDDIVLDSDKRMCHVSAPDTPIDTDTIFFVIGGSRYNYDEVGISSEKVFYVKSKVMEYLNDRRADFTQVYIDIAAKALAEDVEIHCTAASVDNIQHNKLENADDESLSAYINAKLLEKAAVIEKALKEKPKGVEYHVVTLRDTPSGGTDINALQSVLNSHAQEGWRLKKAFTNELGVNSSSIGYGGVTVGTNATIDQLVLIFERENY